MSLVGGVFLLEHQGEVPELRLERGLGALAIAQGEHVRAIFIWNQGTPRAARSPKRPGGVVVAGRVSLGVGLSRDMQGCGLLRCVCDGAATN